MEKQKSPEIYFHVGLGRTATTFMQCSVFPEFKGIHYLKKKQYKHCDKIIADTDHPKYLLSYEFYPSLLIDEMHRFSKKYPDAKIILVLRRQDKWIVSHYKKSVKRGYHKRISDYIDLENDKGFRKKNDLYFYPLIKQLEEIFANKPLVLFHHELKDNPEAFVQKILDYTGVKETEPIDYSPRHISYTNKELLVRRWFSKYFFLKELKLKENSKNKMRRLYNRCLRYPILYFAKIIPEGWLKNKSIVEKDYLKKIEEYYKDDWHKCLQHVQNK